MKKPLGRAKRWSPAVIAELADRDAERIDTAAEAWKRDAPAMFKHLLDAEQPHPSERRVPLLRPDASRS